jgi:hypothetical protein
MVALPFRCLEAARDALRARVGSSERVGALARWLRKTLNVSDARTRL